MTKIVLITSLTPYKENRGGATALPYHLMSERPRDIDIVVYSYNINRLPKTVIKEVEKELNIQIYLLKEPRWIAWLTKKYLKPLRLFLKYPINCYLRLSQAEHESILSCHPDVLWLYGQELSRISKQFKDLRRLHTAPDCYSLHWYRRLASRYTLRTLSEYLLCIINYHKYVLLESHYDTSDNILYHFVGKEDERFAFQMNPKLNTTFIRHPHYELPKSSHSLAFHAPRIRLLLAGRYDLYSREAADELFEALANLSVERKKYFNTHYEFTILGKGWDKKIRFLKQNGILVKLISFAPDYIEEVASHDIQINPISVGTGTKGKVLDAFAAGLLVIATPYALENISVQDRKSCIEYHNAAELIHTLFEIPQNPSRYEQIARCGQTEVLKYHAPATISQKLFETFLSTSSEKH